MSEHQEIPGRSISAIVVSYRTGPVLLHALDALVSDPSITSIHLIDNGNSESDRNAISNFRTSAGLDKLYWVQGHGNIGFARACNYGARLSDGDDLLFINPDAILEPGAMTPLQAALHSGPGLRLVGGCIRDEHGREQRGGRRGRLTIGWAIADLLPGLSGRYDRSGDPEPEGVTPMPTVSGALMMIDRASFETIGGFDERFFLHVEDVDLCERLRRAGGEVLYHPHAVAAHQGGTSDAPRLRVQWYKTVSLLQFFWHSGGLGTKLTTLIVAPLLAAAALLKAFIPRR